jgi:hypothetical protein
VCDFNFIGPRTGSNAVVSTRKMADPNGGVPYLQSYMSLVTHNASRFEYVPIETMSLDSSIHPAHGRSRLVAACFL